MEPTTIGFLAIVLFFVLIALGMPIAFSLTIGSLAGLFYISGFARTVSTACEVFTLYIAQYSMTVIPAFIIMGTIAYRSGILEDVFDAMMKWFGRLPGGLSIGSVVANAVFAAISGSVIAACTVVGRAAIPKMLEAGYSDSRAVGCIAASGTLASLIPPSIAICVYGLIVSRSIGKLLVAGIVPGIISACFYIGYIIFFNRKAARLAKVYTWREKVHAIRYIWVVGVILLAVMGSIYFGIATPTEAGAVGAFGIFVLALVTGKMSVSKFTAAVIDAVKISGIVLFLIGAAAFFGRFLVISDLSFVITEGLIGLSDNRYIVFLCVGIIWFLLGMVIDAVPMLVVSLPVVYPVMMELGFDPIWFGIISIKFCEMAVITPPVGMAIFATHSITPDIPLMTVYKGALRFLSMDVLTVIFLTTFPEVVTFLPNLMM
jgi:tripartite ATP-independent transporter DctM subunit